MPGRPAAARRERAALRGQQRGQQREGDRGRGGRQPGRRRQRAGGCQGEAGLTGEIVRVATTRRLRARVRVTGLTGVPPAVRVQLGGQSASPGIHKAGGSGAAPAPSAQLSQQQAASRGGCRRRAARSARRRPRGGPAPSPSPGWPGWPGWPG